MLCLKSMLNLSSKAVWNLNEPQLQKLLDLGAPKQQGKTIRFYAPSFTYYKTKHFCGSTTEFPTISVTGNTCALNCKHCGGRLLETMHPALSPTELFELGLKLKRDGAKGVLVSGGCLLNGSVPLDDFASTLGRFKRELGLTAFVHTGIIRSATAAALKDAGVDAALIDIIGSNETIKKILNFKIDIEDYVNSLKALTEAKLNVVPHVIVGLNDGKLNGENHALQIIAETTNPSALVIIAFMPIHHTAMAKEAPPKPLDIAKVIATARRLFPKTPLVLGCMRPKGKLRAETDILALKAGVDAIAFPSEEAVEYSKREGFKTAFSSYCCAQIFSDFTL